jgi:hypothetical protein
MQNLRAAAAMLDSCVEQLQLLAPAVPNTRGAEKPDRELGTSVFIVHSSDEGNKDSTVCPERPIFE